MKKLSIIVPVYNEGKDIINPLLQSVSIQQNIDMNDIEVIIVNDGGDELLEKDYLNSFPYEVRYFSKDHEGVSAARQYGLDKAEGEYVNFCDCDDMYMNCCGLWIMFREMEGDGFDSMMSAFIEETRTADNQIIYINHDQNSTFVHGIFHRRKYLIDKNIRWNKDLFVHEDSYFNVLALNLSENVKYCPTPFYLWKWRDNSVCRHSPLYLNITYRDMLKSNTALINLFLERDLKDKAIFFSTSMIYDAYYCFNCDKWWSTDGHEYLKPSELKFKEYWNTFKDLFNECSQEVKNQIIIGLKNRFFQEGMFMERITFDDWIKHIENLKENVV